MTEITNLYRLHDEHLLELLQAQAKAGARLDGAATTLRYVVGQHKQYMTRNTFVWRKSRTDGTRVDVQDAIAAAEQLIADGDAYVLTYSGKPSMYLARYNEALGMFQAAGKAVRDHEALYTGWQRYWLCCSSNGHVHHASCSSFRPTTRIALVPSLSAASVESAVDVLGTILCSKCFPEAPVEWQDNGKIPESVATVLYEQGEPAFRKALDEWKTKQAAKAAKAVK